MATKAQLAALAKGRAALAKKRKAKPAAKKTVKKTVKKKDSPRRKNNPRPRTGLVKNFAVFLTKVTPAGKMVGKRYYYDIISEGWHTDLRQLYTENRAKNIAGREGKNALDKLPAGWGVAVEKKPVAGRGRKPNPVPASKAYKAKQAIERYEDFTGHKADHYYNIQMDWPDVGLQVGHCDGILYSTVRDGVREKYIHRFKQSARPVLAASHDGEQLALIGGNFEFTARGIVDK